MLTVDEARPILRHAYLGVTGRKITWLDTNPPQGRARRTLTAPDYVLLPGFFNTHTHLGMSVLRGYADDYELDTWLKKYIWPAEAKLTEAAVTAANALSLAEAIASGTISFTDMYFFEPQLAQLCLSAGCMANLSNGAMSFDQHYDKAADRAWGEMEVLARDYHNADGGRIKADAAIHAEYTSHPECGRLFGLCARKGAQCPCPFERNARRAGGLRRPLRHDSRRPARQIRRFLHPHYGRPLRPCDA